jgi:orotidine-5'-phosphate decarboxylase
MKSNPADRIAVALDTSDWDEFCRWCRIFGSRVGLLKVGLEAFLRWGPAAVDEAGARASVFLDLKLHDIPNTVAGAVKAARDLGVDYLTVHATGGAEMLRAASEAGQDRVRILAVTLLTHMDGESLAGLGIEGQPESLVPAWAKLAAEAGCAGAVCSPREVARLRTALPEPFVLVTPGVRPAGSVLDDQRRTATPAEALAAGADVLVVGRPLTRSADPEAALERMLASL